MQERHPAVGGVAPTGAAWCGTGRGGEFPINDVKPHVVFRPVVFPLRELGKKGKIRQHDEQIVRAEPHVLTENRRPGESVAVGAAGTARVVFVIAAAVDGFEDPVCVGDHDECGHVGEGGHAEVAGCVGHRHAHPALHRHHAARGGIHPIRLPSNPQGRRVGVPGGTSRRGLPGAPTLCRRAAEAFLWILVGRLRARRLARLFLRTLSAMGFASGMAVFIQF